MMKRVTYVKPEDLPKQGWTIKEIATKTGYHSATISNCSGRARRRCGWCPMRPG